MQFYVILILLIINFFTSALFTPISHYPSFLSTQLHYKTSVDKSQIHPTTLMNSLLRDRNKRVQPFAGDDVNKSSVNHNQRNPHTHVYKAVFCGSSVTEFEKLRLRDAADSKN
jgi:hypothetical protein